MNDKLTESGAMPLTALIGLLVPVLMLAQNYVFGGNSGTFPVLAVRDASEPGSMALLS